ncbi:apolipoprotein N-acyltransferase [Phaeacidiphilus oryzae]|uniref:apolipoprotein N-acyltransferase n=1 Tax=Phaeacidiphilus oryzae TaxID=348818 RepID=UPI000B2AC171
MTELVVGEEPRGARRGLADGIGRLGRRAAAPAATVAAGALPLLCFPDPGQWWLAGVALVPAILVLRSAGTARQAARRGWYAGTGFLLGVMSWLAPSLGVFILGLAALLGLLWAPWGWLVWRLLAGRPEAGRSAAALVLLPSGWLLIETVRSWQYLGGPWGLMGASQWRFRPALALASIGGVWLVSWLLLAVNTAVALLVIRRGRGPVGWLALVAVVLTAGNAAAWAPQPRLRGTAAVGVVQPGLGDSARERTARAEVLTRMLTVYRPDLVVWGESSIDSDLARHPAELARLSRDSAAVGADLLVNVDARRGGPRPGIYKSSVLLSPSGLTGQRYDKIRLVPFGEYVPLRPLLGWVAGMSKAAGEDRMRGAGPVLIRTPRLVVGPLICFESAFPDMSRTLAGRGAQVLVVQSSTATFQHTWAPEQHASLAALRAAETGRSVVQGTLTGVSAAYDPLGRPVGQWLSTSTSGSTVYRVPLATGGTLYDRWGDWVPHGGEAVLALATLLGLAGVLRRRQGRRIGLPHGR